MDEDPFNLLNLTTFNGIAVITLFLVEALKNQLKDIPWFNKVPVIVYNLIVATTLAILANRVLKNSDGVPLLQGNSLGVVVWRAVDACLAASGLYSVIKKPQENPQTAGKLLTKRKSLLPDDDLN